MHLSARMDARMNGWGQLLACSAHPLFGQLSDDELLRLQQAGCVFCSARLVAHRHCERGSPHMSEHAAGLKPCLLLAPQCGYLLGACPGHTVRR
jgi:hypothetical protein